MALYGMALASLLLAGVNSTFPSQDEQARISKPYADCLNAAANRTDDGRADLAVVAKVVAAACRPQFDQMIAALGQTLNADDRQRLKISQSEMEIGYAAVAVGRVRAMRRNAPKR